MLLPSSLQVITKPGLQALLRMDSVDSAAKLLDAHPNNTVMISDTQVTLKSVFTQNSLRGVPCVPVPAS